MLRKQRENLEYLNNIKIVFTKPTILVYNTQVVVCQYVLIL